MKLTIIALTVIAVAMAYDEKFDRIDVDKILSDDALFTSYINCLLDKGPCEVELATEFKELLPEVLTTACGKCTKIQKKNFQKILKGVIERKPDSLLEFKKKYDPNNVLESTVKKLLLD